MQVTGYILEGTGRSDSSNYPEYQEKECNKRRPGLQVWEDQKIVGGYDQRPDVGDSGKLLGNHTSMITANDRVPGEGGNTQTRRRHGPRELEKKMLL